MLQALYSIEWVSWQCDRVSTLIRGQLPYLHFPGQEHCSLWEDTWSKLKMKAIQSKTHMTWQGIWAGSGRILMALSVGKDNWCVQFTGILRASAIFKTSAPFFKTSDSFRQSLLTRALLWVMVGHAWATWSFLQPAGTTWDQKRQFPSENSKVLDRQKQVSTQRLLHEVFQH